MTEAMLATAPVNTNGAGFCNATRSASRAISRRSRYRRRTASWACLTLEPDQLAAPSKRETRMLQERSWTEDPFDGRYGIIGATGPA